MGRFKAENSIPEEASSTNRLMFKTPVLMVSLLLVGVGLGYGMAAFTGPISGPARTSIAILPSQVQFAGMSMDWSTSMLTIQLQASSSTSPISGSCTATFTDPSGVLAARTGSYSGLEVMNPVTVTLTYTEALDSATRLDVIC